MLSRGCWLETVSCFNCKDSQDLLIGAWIKEFRKADHLKHNYKNKLDQVCFAHNAAYSDNKDLAKRTIYDKILKDRAYRIAINREYDRYQRELASMVNRSFDKKAGLGASVNEKLAQELRKPVIK